MDKVILIQDEYKNLLITLLPQLQSSYAPQALDEINLFWNRKMNIIRLFLEYIVPNADSFVFTGISYLDYDKHEHIPFLMIGEQHILDDPLGRYSELCRMIPEGRDADYLYELIGRTAEDNIKVLENLCSHILIIPLRLLAQSKADDVFFQKSEELFLSLFIGIDSIEDYYKKCNSIDDIAKYICKDLSSMLWFSENDNPSLSFKERFMQAVENADFVIDSSQSDAYNFFYMIFGYINQALSILACCKEYYCFPYIRNRITFHYLNMIVSSITINDLQINTILFKASITLALHKICNLDLLASIKPSKLLKTIDTYNCNKKIMDRVSLTATKEGRKELVPQMINEELIKLYQYLSEQ